MDADVEIGLERCRVEPPRALLRGRRFGLLMNQASVDRNFRYACDLLAESYPGQLAAIFTPQHGLWGEEQANMIESPHGTYKLPLDRRPGFPARQPDGLGSPSHDSLGIPVYSLYSETRRPTPEMLKAIECFVIDLQDVGTRVYTFAWTIQQCLHACAEANIPVVILDRPNPLGRIVEGPLLEPGYESFVGGATIPMRHGLTLGELARLMNAEQGIGAELEVVGQVSNLSSDDSGQVENLSYGWVPPSPNMPRLKTALVYPGQVLLEGTNLSEGRGTTTPFEVCGAPFIDPHALARELDAYPHPGLVLRPVRFVPTFDKWRGQSCGGVYLHIVDSAAVRSVAFTVSLLAVVKRLYAQHFEWLPPPYEYEREKMPIDILFGSAKLRERLEHPPPITADDITTLTAIDETAWERRLASFRSRA
ncbi:MAG TPA: DUF1343 domain-containing protein [Pirellulaceae bacterium]|nr:DUF1343 domain-containing protein [Pirellulaceae bacterium]